MTVHTARELDTSVSVDELLAVVPYFSQHRSMMEAATELAIPFARIRAIVEQIADIDQPGLLGVRAFEVDYHNSFDVRIRPHARLLSQPHALTAEETATLLLILETIEDSAAGASSTAAQTAAVKLRQALGTSVPIIDSAASHDGRTFAFSEQIYEALQHRKVLKVRYRNASGEITVRELDCVNVYTVESSTYLRAVDRAEEGDRQKSFRVDRLEAAEVLETSAGFHRPVPVDIRDPHAFGAETGTSKWASVLIDADATWIADYEPVFFTDEEGQAEVAGQDTGQDAGQVSAQPAFAADVPMSDLAATVSFVLRRSPSVKVSEPLKLKNAVVARASEALAEYGRNDKA